MCPESDRSKQARLEDAANGRFRSVRAQRLVFLDEAGSRAGLLVIDGATAACSRGVHVLKLLPRLACVERGLEQSCNEGGMDEVWKKRKHDLKRTCDGGMGR